MDLPRLSGLVRDVVCASINVPRLSTVIGDVVQSLAVSVNVLDAAATDRAIAQFRNEDLIVTPWTPIAGVDIGRPLGNRIMAECLHNVPSAKYANEVSAVIEGDLPISSYEHDCAQLMFGRTSRATGKLAPRCQHNETVSCCADQLPFASSASGAGSGALGCQVYLSPAEEEVFQMTGEARPGPCLMCIRRDISILAYQYSGIATPQTVVEGAKIVPPFTNLVNIHNGYVSAGSSFTIRAADARGFRYHIEAIISSPLIVGNVVGMDGNCHVSYNPETKRWGVNQHHLMWTPDPVQSLN